MATSGPSEPWKGADGLAAAVVSASFESSYGSKDYNKDRSTAVRHRETAAAPLPTNQKGHHTRGSSVKGGGVGGGNRVGDGCGGRGGMAPFQDSHESKATTSFDLGSAAYAQ